MQITSTSVTSSYAAPGASRSQKAESASNASDAHAGAGISTYDFSSMSPAQMRSTVNDLIRSGKMTLTESSPLLGMMMPPAHRMDNQPIDAFANLRAGITGAQSRGDRSSVESLGQTLDALLRLQGTTASFMEWTDEGIILGVRRHGESSAIVELLTRGHGRHLGLVRGGAGTRMRPVLQPGNTVSAIWRARLDEHLGFYQIEGLQMRAATVLAS
eukprot:gene40808-55160_t